MTMPHTPPQGAAQMFRWYRQSQVDYAVHYMQLYIAYNAWYREVTNAATDREALALLKKRFVIWDDYIQGKTMQPLQPYMKRLTELTQRQSFPALTLYWDGEFKDRYDWRSLIEFWYQVRCLIVHGAEYQHLYAWLAYETLNIFLGEIVDRMEARFDEGDLQKLKTLTTSGKSDNSTNTEEGLDRFKQLQQTLYEKYIASPNIWHVDMQRVAKNP